MSLLFVDLFKLNKGSHNLRNTRVFFHRLPLAHKPETLWKSCISSAKFSSAPEKQKFYSVKKWSYLNGPSDRPLVGTTIGQLMEQAAERHPDKEAFVSTHQGQRLTFEQLLQKSDQLAAGLISLGAQYKDRIGIWAPNCMEWILVQYATARAGLILVNINPAYQASELEFAVNNAGIKILVIFNKYRNQDFYTTLHHACAQASEASLGIPSKRLPDLNHVVLIGDEHKPGTILFSELMSLSNNENVKKITDLQNKLQFDDPINIQFTSGTTGSPKGTTLSHHNIINNALLAGYRLKYNEHNTRLCMPVPLYHCFGMVIGSLESICHSVTVILPGYTFNARETIEAAESEKCTAIYGTPTMFIDYLNLPDIANYDLSSLDSGIMAGAVCPVEVLKQCVNLLGTKHLAVCYGCTENSPGTFLSKYDDSFERRTTTVGQILDYTEAKIVDAKEKIVPLGQSGELYTRGYMVMIGYWRNEAQTNATMSGNWYKTGDLAYFDEEGYCVIVGRKKDMLIRGGENIYPAEIEQALYKHPSVADVQVIGVPDERLGEQVAAWIILKEGKIATEKEIIDYCKEKMAYFKIPHYITFVKSFPLTVTGKVQKYKMRKEAIKLYNLEHLVGVATQ